MANGTFDLTFDSIAHEDDFGGGVRFATDWKGEDGRMWRVSSVDHSTATETMIFLMMDGEPTYFDLDGVKEYMGSSRDHGEFLAEYLQRELDQVDDLAPGLPKSVRIRKCPPDLSTFTENSP
jgi:hypothetical protein